MMAAKIAGFQIENENGQKIDKKGKKSDVGRENENENEKILKILEEIENASDYDPENYDKKMNRFVINYYYYISFCTIKKFL